MPSSQTPPRPHRLARAALATLALCAGATSSQAFDYKISGHVNRMLTSVDDGTENRLFHADNVNSQTRLRFTGSQEFAPGMVAGIYWEVGWTSNPSSGISFADPSVDATWNERHTEIFLSSPWGKLSLGQGDGAANGGMEVDLSGTSLITYSAVTDIGGSFAFRQAGVFGPTIGSTISNNDFESRYDRLRYDTPAFGPVTLSASYGTKDSNDVYELAARAETTAAGGKLAAALGWSRDKGGGLAGEQDTVGGSVSWLAANGLNLTLALSSVEDDNPASERGKFAYGKVGYITGKHAMAIDFGRGEDFAAAGDRSDYVGVGYVYSAASWLELYAGLKQHQLDRPGASFDDITFVSAGARLKF